MGTVYVCNRCGMPLEVANGAINMNCSRCDKATEKESAAPGSPAARGSAALVHHWTDRRTRKLHNAKVAAAKGDYTTALKEAAEADAILLCLQDLNTEMPPNAKLSDRPTQTP